jgi:ribA/ribD-fused uncharacterized protein
MQDLFFYRANDAFGEFSNFWWAEIEVDGRVWPTTEHYFQAAKFFHTDPGWARHVAQTGTPGQAARAGRSRAHPLDPRWESIKDDVMRRALLAKFTQHPDLRDLLLSTRGKFLVEHTRNDSYWGDGSNGRTRGRGVNRLGKLLNELRAVLDGGDLEAHQAKIDAALAGHQLTR